MHLSPSETLIMKCIWSSEDGLTVAEVRQQLKAVYGRESERTTVCTFMRKLEQKGVILGYRQKSAGYRYRPLVGEKELRDEKRREFVNIWYDGSISSLINALKEDEKKVEA